MEEIYRTKGQGAVADELTVLKYLKERWSPRSFKDTPISPEILVKIFEAGSTSMSSYNEQPWNIVLAKKGDANYQILFNCLNEFNQQWAHLAPYLGAVIARKYFKNSRKENRHRQYDSGAFMAYSSLQACELGYQIHQMAGFSPGKLMMDMKIPHIYEAVTMFVIGKPGSPDNLPTNLQKEEGLKQVRKDVTSFVFGNKWGTPYNFD